MRPASLPSKNAPARRAAGRWRWTWLLSGLATLVGTGQAAEAPHGCGLLWRVTARLESQPRQLQVEIDFDAAGRSSTTLRLPGGWADVTEMANGPADTATVPPRLLPVPGAPALRQVQHAPGERVRLQWRLVPTQGGPQASSAQLAARWLAFSGQAVLPMPVDIDERAPPQACIALSGLAPGGRWLSSHGGADTPDAWLRVNAGTAGTAPLAVRIQQALFVGGQLQIHTASAEGTPLSVALPQEGAWRFNAEGLHRAAAGAIAAQRRYWGANGVDRDDTPPWLVLLMPAGAGGSGGTAWHRALALQATPALDLPGAGFDLLMTQALARAWVVERFGPLAHAGRGDEALRAWFSEGLADFLAHRALLRQGQWTPTDYAAALHRKIDAYLRASGPDAGPAVDRLALAAAQGEALALRWHAALLAAGRPGLEAQLQRLLVPAAQARREGPISAPLATHRLLAAVRPVLGDEALADLQRHVEQGVVIDFGPTALGPCFAGRREAVGRWQLGFDPVSLQAGVLMGVEPGSAAEAAGLRNGLLLRGHTLAPGDATQPVWLRLQDGSAAPVEVTYLPASPPLRDLPRYEAVPQALQRPDCQAWLGPAAQAAGLFTPPGRPAAGAAGAAPGRPAATAPASTRQSARPQPGSAAKAGSTRQKPAAKAKAKATTPSGAKAAKAKPKTRQPNG